MTEVILVNTSDEPIGAMEKIEAHEKALLHRAFSVFIFNERGEMLLQRRADTKYHSPGLWSNACCSHPFPGEDTMVAAQRRLKEELGFSTTLEKIFDFIYKVSFENGLTEYEFDHVFIGTYSQKIEANPIEVNSYCYKSLNAIKKELEDFPGTYTEWFKIAFPKIEKYLSGISAD